MIKILHIPSGNVIHGFPTYLHFKAFILNPEKYSHDVSTRKGTLSYLSLYEPDILDYFEDMSIIPKRESYRKNSLDVKTLSLLEFEILDD